jgi:hypothetical protein
MNALSDTECVYLLYATLQYPEKSLYSKNITPFFTIQQGISTTQRVSDP